MIGCFKAGGLVQRSVVIGSPKLEGWSAKNQGQWWTSAKMATAYFDKIRKDERLWR